MIRRLVPFLTALALLALAVLVSVTTEVSLVRLTRDTAATGELPPYTGAISTLGLLLWSASATTCFFSASLLRDCNGAERVTRFLIASGVLTTLLMADDAFLLHENAKHIGIPEESVYLAYAVAAGMLFWTYRGVIWAGEPYLLALAGVLFMLAIGADVLHDLDLLDFFGPDSVAIAFLIEDGLKFLGIVGWLNYYLWTSLGYLRRTSETAV